jgi:hypothetical protein
MQKCQTRQHYRIGGLDELGLVMISRKLEGFFAKYPKPWLNDTRPLLLMKRGGEGKGEGRLIKRGEALPYSYPDLG